MEILDFKRWRKRRVVLKNCLNEESESKVESIHVKKTKYVRGSKSTEDWTEFTSTKKKFQHESRKKCKKHDLTSRSKKGKEKRSSRKRKSKFATDSKEKSNNLLPDPPNEPSSESYNANFQKKVLSHLAEVNVKLEKVLEQTPSKFKIVQINDEEEFQRHEVELMDSTKYNETVSQLKRTGGRGSNVRECVHRVLNRILANNVMALFNMKGNRGKMAFTTTRLFKAISEAVSSIQSSTEKEIYDAINTCLKYDG